MLGSNFEAWHITNGMLWCEAVCPVLWKGNGYLRHPVKYFEMVTLISSLLGVSESFLKQWVVPWCSIITTWYIDPKLMERKLCGFAVLRSVKGSMSSTGLSSCGFSDKPCLLHSGRVTLVLKSKEGQNYPLSNFHSIFCWWLYVTFGIAVMISCIG